MAYLLSRKRDTQRLLFWALCGALLASCREPFPDGAGGGPAGFFGSGAGSGGGPFQDPSVQPQELCDIPAEVLLCTSGNRGTARTVVGAAVVGGYWDPDQEPPLGLGGSDGLGGMGGHSEAPADLWMVSIRRSSCALLGTKGDTGTVRIWQESGRAFMVATGDVPCDWGVNPFVSEATTMGWAKPNTLGGQYVTIGLEVGAGECAMISDRDPVFDKVLLGDDAAALNRRACENLRDEGTWAPAPADGVFLGSGGALFLGTGGLASTGGFAGTGGSLGTGGLGAASGGAFGAGGTLVATGGTFGAGGTLGAGGAFGAGGTLVATGGTLGAGGAFLGSGGLVSGSGGFTR